MTALSGLVGRIVRDALAPARQAAYEAILAAAAERGYEATSVAGYLTAPSKPGRALILRHDADLNDPGANARLLASDRATGGTASFYFRWKTVEAHARLVDSLLAAGFEVGYHFEEGAAAVKRHGLRHRDEVFARRSEIAAEFRENCAEFRRKWSPSLRTATAHGDWINRSLGFRNEELLADEDYSACGLLVEAEDARVRRWTGAYCSDAGLPRTPWIGESPVAALARAPRSLYLLTHERYWTAARTAKIRADVRRLSEAVTRAMHRREAAGAGAARFAGGPAA